MRSNPAIASALTLKSYSFEKPNPLVGNLDDGGIVCVQNVRSSMHFLALCNSGKYGLKR
jgi:hypothetical protein